MGLCRNEENLCLGSVRPFACGVKDTKNFDLAFSQTIKNDKRCSCDYQFASSIYPALTP